jgi:cyclopropane-fatty-acyl-phospholipid synthase
MFEKIIRRRLQGADIVPGRGEWGDPEIVNSRFWHRVAIQGSLGLGESYMDGDWECTHLDVLVYKLLQAGLHEAGTLRLMLSSIAERLRSAAHRAGARHLGEHHYSIGNDLYEAMLGPTMAYTCAYWTENTSTLEQAQEAKLEMVCRKLGLKPGMTLLDIGCGWGSLLRYAAEHYGVRGTGITVSSKQMELARQRCLGFPVRILLQDYRDVRGQFDRIASIGMFEHVERRYHRSFMQACQAALLPGGIGLLHTIGKDQASPPDPWIRKYIFPLGDIPTIGNILKSSLGILQWHRWHALGGHHYDRTLKAWYENFWAWYRPEKMSGSDAERFSRMWRFYLLGCAGAFQAGSLDVWQMVFSRTEDSVTIPDVHL